MRYVEFKEDNEIHIKEKSICTKRRKGGGPGERRSGTGHGHAALTPGPKREKSKGTKRYAIEPV